MKSIIKEEKGELGYPCLKESVTEDGKIVVLFIAPKTGMVVFSDGKRSEVNPIGNMSGLKLNAGTVSIGWGWYEKKFTPFNGVIELSNN